MGQVAYILQKWLPIRFPFDYYPGKDFEASKKYQVQWFKEGIKDESVIYVDTRNKSV